MCPACAPRWTAKGRLTLGSIEYLKPLVKRPLLASPQVGDLRPIKLIIRRSEVRVLPAPHGNALVGGRFSSARREFQDLRTASMPHRCRNLRRIRIVRRVQVIREAVHLVWVEVSVEVQRHLDARMSEVRLDGFGMSSLGYQHRLLRGNETRKDRRHTPP